MKIVDASFIASYSRRTGDRPDQIVRRLDSEDTTFVLVKYAPVIKGKALYVKTMEEASATAFEMFALRNGNPELFTDEVKVVEAVFITGTTGQIIMPPTRAGCTASSVLTKSVTIVPPVRYENERRIPVNIKGAVALRKYLETNPDAQVVDEEQGIPVEAPAVVLSKDKNGLENGIFYYQVIPIIGVHGTKYPTEMLKRAIKVIKQQIQTEAVPC